MQTYLQKIDHSQFSQQEFSLLLKTLTFILKRAVNFIMKPTKLQQDLREKLKLDQQKTEIFLKYWRQLTKPILDNLGDTSIQLNDVSWELKVQLSSSAQQKEKCVIGCLTLETNVKEDPILLEMTRGECFKFYEELEKVQEEIDLLRKKA